MKEKIHKISLYKLKEVIPEIQIDNDIIIFDNFDKPFDFNIIEDFYSIFDFTFTIFVLEGSLTIQAGHEKYFLSTHDWMFIIEGKFYRTLKFSDNTKVGMCCTKSTFLDFNPDIKKATYFYNSIIKYPVINIPKEKASEYLNAFKYIKKNIRDKENLGRLQIVKHYCYIIFLIICDIIMKKNKLANNGLSHQDAIFQTFLKYVEKHYKSERSVKFYADKLCFTPKYLSSVIYHVSGKHASEWLDSYIELEIKMLLKSTDITIQQIAYELNFSSPSHFGKFFKRLTGLSPKAYRRN
jgi:AraC-like DNA-binding protein